MFLDKNKSRKPIIQCIKRSVNIYGKSLEKYKPLTYTEIKVIVNPIESRGKIRIKRRIKKVFAVSLEREKRITNPLIKKNMPTP